MFAVRRGVSLTNADWESNLPPAKQASFTAQASILNDDDGGAATIDRIVLISIACKPSGSLVVQLELDILRIRCLIG